MKHYPPSHKSDKNIHSYFCKKKYSNDYYSFIKLFVHSDIRMLSMINQIFFLNSSYLLEFLSIIKVHAFKYLSFYVV